MTNLEDLKLDFEEEELEYVQLQLYEIAHWPGDDHMVRLVLAGGITSEWFPKDREVSFPVLFGTTLEGLFFVSKEIQEEE